MKTRSKWIIAGAVAVVVAGAASASMVVSAQSGGQSQTAPAGQSSTPTPSPIPYLVPPTTAPGAPSDAIVSASEDLIENVLAVTNTVNAGDIDVVLDSLRPVASSAFLSGVEAERMELEDQGWTRSGTVVIDGIESVSYDAAADPATATVRACLDWTDVVVRNADGDALPAGAPRAWNIYNLELVDGAWMIMQQTFADDPAC